jgi:hypothetical protein
LLSGGISWRASGVTKAATLARMGPAMAADPAFALLIGQLYDRAEAAGMLAR